MKKKIISLMISMTMILSGFSAAYAADETDGGSPAQGEDNRTEAGVAEGETEDSGQEGVLSFTDVQDSAQYYYTPVYWAVEKNITTGITDTEFAPDGPCTRGQMITFLYRSAGSPQISSEENPFEDIGEEEYYKDAVLWAVESNIAKGTTETAFSPDEICSRAHCLTFLWRYFGSPDQTVSPDFDDVPSDAYYAGPVFWSLINGITNGVTETGFRPDQKCTRAQAMTFFYRSMKKKVDAEYVRETQDLSEIAFHYEASGRTGNFTLQASGLSDFSGLTEVQTAVWTKDDQSDIRWFTMNADETGDSYSVTRNVSSFRRHFGEYHASLFLTRKVEDELQLAEVLDGAFVLEADHYLYVENAGMGWMTVTVLGVGPDVSALNIAAWDREKGPAGAVTAAAARQTDGSWTATIDWLLMMEGGTCCLELTNVSDPQNALILNTAEIELARVKKLIDVSQYQGVIDWSAAGKSGLFDAVLVRCGLRNSSGRCLADKRFHTNAQACMNEGIPMGFYWFTSALTENEAREEADYCLNLIREYPADYPVFLDTEQGSRSGLNSLSRAKRTACVRAFLDRIGEAGYETGIYASTAWYRANLDFSKLEGERIWVASWNGRPSYPAQYIGWQYSPKGIIPGITQNTTDLSYWFE